MLDLAFGSGTDADPESRARASDRTFVRSMDQLAEASDRATGRRLTAWEALRAYGLDTLAEVGAEGAALLSDGPRAAGRLLRDRRELLELSPRNVANAANISVKAVEDAEAFKRVPIRQLERMARALGLDERWVSFRPDPPPGNEQLAIRLRSIGQDHARMSAATVSGIAEAAWVATTQLRLQRALGIHPERPDISPSPNYGGPGYPAYMHGYWLARDTRQRLGLGTDPIPSLRELAEDTLGIPVIQAELNSSIAGVTVEAGDDRAIVLNIEGRNRQVFVRRSTLAHELGHLLYDPAAYLQRLRVDDYDQLERAPHEIPDRVEQRANAFSVEIIAPRDAALRLFEADGDDPLSDVMDAFGISFTAARYQIWNALERKVPLEELTADPRRRPDPGWEAREAYTVDYHPVRNIRPSRAGRFSAVVFRAAEDGLISWDTATEMLESNGPEELKRCAAAMHDLFPGVFGR